MIAGSTRPRWRWANSPVGASPRSPQAQAKTALGTLAAGCPDPRSSRPRPALCSASASSSGSSGLSWRMARFTSARAWVKLGDQETNACPSACAKRSFDWARDRVQGKDGCSNWKPGWARTAGGSEQQRAPGSPCSRVCPPAPAWRQGGPSRRQLVAARSSALVLYERPRSECGYHMTAAESALPRETNR
jgi:hypothetical protein